MAQIIELDTQRLKMRQWGKEDFPVFALMNSDPIVMEYFPYTLNASESMSCTS